MLALVPVLDSVNALPAVRYVIRESIAGDTQCACSTYALGAAGMMTSRWRARLDRFNIRHTTLRTATTRMQSSAPCGGADLIVLGTARYGSATLTEDAVVQASTTRQLH